MATLKEALRRIYHEMVIRRSTVRVIPAQAKTDLDCSPIFLMGIYRSGTTLLRYIVDSHSHICCPPESDFIAYLIPLINDRKCQIGLKRMGFEEDHVVQKLREFCLYFFENYAAACGKARWADKTPAYVDHLDFLLRLFPESQFVMIHRHGLDQAHSYTRGGTFMRETLRGYCRDGEDLRIGAVRYWHEKTQRVLDFEERRSEKCIHVLYERLCESSEEQLRLVFDFLGESWEPEVLEFYKFSHDKGAEDGRVMATSGISASRGHYHRWPPELVERCARIAESTLSRLGYKV
jgi:protein-tyrosine sulfotransferase